MNAQSVIRCKRDGGALSPEQMEAFVSGVASGNWSNGQTGAMLMALFQRGLNLEETRSLLNSMLDSGDCLDMSGLDRPVVDKHSTGGVGDKVSIVLAPLAAACGLAVPMLSGRGLGHTGGTLDKLESIPGLNVFLSAEAIRKQVQSVGCVIAGQTEALVPADKVLYAMRDETSTVEHPSLIAASILSKKLAEDIGCLLLDVKFGRGAFLQELRHAEELAQLMVDLGKAAGCRVAAWLTRMDTPLGRAVGNAVEIEECIAILRNEGPDELTDLIVEQVAGLLCLAGIAPEQESAVTMTRDKLVNGSALNCFAAMVKAQGGDPSIVDDPRRLPQARNVLDIHFEEPRKKSVADVDALAIAGIVLETGAGRMQATDDVDHSCGISQLAVPGDCLEPGDMMARLHHADPGRESEWVERIRNAITLQDEPFIPPQRIYKRIDSGSKNGTH